MSETPVVAVDLFCGAGGLSLGLQQSGVGIAAGIDLDPACIYPYEVNIGAPFVERDVSRLDGTTLKSLFPSGAISLLAGCAPCQPFSSHRRGQDTSAEAPWALLGHFERLVRETQPVLVTMENVPRIQSTDIFIDFVRSLTKDHYWVDWQSCYCPSYGVPQERRRLVLIASKLGPVRVPDGSHDEKDFLTVRRSIGALPPIVADRSATDPLHFSRKLSPLNLRRIQASVPNGTWEDWPTELRAPCHQRPSGSTYRNVYARMDWDKPAPTITTLFHNFGAGRFGHPDQDRPLSLREGALLQGFPADYVFVKNTETPHASTLGRLIGNAVPPPLAFSIGSYLREHVGQAPQ